VTDPTASANGDALLDIEALDSMAAKCPFCGSRIDGDKYFGPECTVECAKCGATARTLSHWNCRATQPAPEYREALEREKEILRNGNRVVVGAIDEFRAAVRELFALRKDGPCLAERAPSRDTDCLHAFQRLNDTGARLASITDKLREIHSSAAHVEPAPEYREPTLEDMHPLKARISNDAWWVKDKDMLAALRASGFVVRETK
jgi:hypothetical protein